MGDLCPNPGSLGSELPALWLPSCGPSGIDSDRERSRAHVLGGISRAQARVSISADASEMADVIRPYYVDVVTARRRPRTAQTHPADVR
jgi:hypothetical protein